MPTIECTIGQRFFYKTFYDIRSGVNIMSKVTYEYLFGDEPLFPTVGVFGPPMSKFVFACLAQMVSSEDTRVYTGLGGTSLCLVHCCLCYWHLVCSRGYKQVGEGEDPKSLVEEVNGC